MKIAYNPLGSAVLTVSPPENDITFDLPGKAIWAKGIKFGWYTTFSKDTSAASGYNGLVPAPNYNNNSTTRFLREDGTWVVPTNTTYSVVSSTANGLAPKVINTNTTTVTNAYYVLASTNGSAAPSWYKLPATTFANDNTTYTLSGALDDNTFVSTLTPSSGNVTTSIVPAMTAATASAAGTAGLVPAPAAGNQNKFLKGDGTWATPTDSHYTTHLYVGASGTAAKGSTTNGNTYIKLYDNSTARESYKIVGTGRVTVTSDANGNIAINTPETIAWGSVTGKPTSFAPSAHTHSTKEITSLTEYSKATEAGDLATSDSLNIALGKLEHKADTAYKFIIETMSETDDSNTTIDRLKEVFDVLSGITETDTITALVGKYIPLAGSTAITGSLVPKTTNSINLGSSSIKWANIYATTFHGALSGNASSASKLGSSTLGSTTKPIYLSSGTATECSTYAGGTAVTLNGTSKAASTASFYAPTDVGTSGQILKSNGSGAPTWVNQSTLTVGLTTDLKGGAAGSIPYQNAEDSTVFLAAPTTNGYVLKYNTTNKAPYWAADIDTNTWRKIQLNGTDILGSATNTNALNFVAGDNVTINNSNGTLTISSSYTNTNTWRTIDVQNSSGTSLGSLGSATTTGALTLKAGSNVTLSFASGVVTIASSNTDTKVTQTLDDSTNANLRLLLTSSALTATSTTTAKFATDLTYNPSTNMLTTPNLTTNTINGETVYRKIEKTVSIALKKNWTALTSIDFTSTDFDGDGSYIVQVKNDNYGVWTGYFTVRTSGVVSDSTTDDEIILQGGAKSGYNRPYLKTINTSGKVQLSMAYNVDLSTETTWYFYFKRII